jgi:hypothetical protein
MISVLATSVVDRGFERGSSQAKDYDIGLKVHINTSEWLLFNAKWAIVLVYHGENKLYAMMMMSALF